MRQSLEAQTEQLMANRTVSLLWPTVTLLIGIFAIGTDELVISPMLMDVSNTLHSSLRITVLAVSLYGLMIALTAPTVAPLCDRLSRRTVMLIALGGFVAASVVCATAQTLPALLVGRGLSGLAAGTFVPCAYAYVGDIVAFPHRGRVMGGAQSGWAAALVIGVPFGGWLCGQLGWRATFDVIALLGAIAMGMVFLLPNVRVMSDHRTERIFDRTFMRNINMAVRTPGVLSLIFVTFCDMFGFYGAYTYFGSFVRYAWHYGPTAVAGLIMVYGIGLAFSPITGRLADRYGQHKLLLASLVTLTAVLIALPYTDSGVPLPLLVPTLLLWGSAQSAALTTLSTLLSEVSEAQRGQVMGLYSSATNIAVALGSSVMGAVYTKWGYGVVGLLCGAVTLLGTMALAAFQAER